MQTLINVASPLHSSSFSCSKTHFAVTIRVFSLYYFSLVDFLQHSAAFFTSSLEQSLLHNTQRLHFSVSSASSDTHPQQHSHVHALPAVHRATHTPFPAMHGDTHPLHSLASDSTTKAVLPILSDICLSDSCPLAIFILSGSDLCLLSTP